MNAVQYSTHETPVKVRATECSPIGAVIDIGSNSVKLLVGQLRGTSVEPLFMISQPVKIGQGSFQTRRLRPDTIERVTKSVADLTRRARSFSPSVFRIVATSAVREAVNRSDLIRAIETRIQKRIEILSGEEEARFVFESVRREPGLAGMPL